MHIIHHVSKWITIIFYHLLSCYSAGFDVCDVCPAGTVAEGAPIIPISAQMKYNIEVVCEYIVKKIPVPIRDFTSEPRLIGKNPVFFLVMFLSLHITLIIISAVKSYACLFFFFQLSDLLM